MSSPEVERFVRAARDFCTFIETAERLTPEERRDTAREHFASVYAAAVQLPMAEPDTGDDRVDVPKPSWPGFPKQDLYWCALEPFDTTAEKPELGCGSLDDDVLDTYRDLKRGLLLWDGGREGSAVFEWRLHFHAHWGSHATRALSALHELWSKW